MVAKCYSATISGVNARTVEIEVYSRIGTSSFAIVGLPDAATKEARDRIPTAINNSAIEWYDPKREYSVTVNLAPADVKKEGSLFDLPIAMCFLKAIGLLHVMSLENYAMVGELSLSGEVRRVNGILPIVMEMKRIGRRTVLVPYDNRLEASVVEGIEVVPVRTLQEAVAHVNGEVKISPVYSDLAGLIEEQTANADDFADVKGQDGVVRAMEIAVAGGHNILMVGSPGSGKTMIARRVPTILPPLTVEEALEVSRIHSVAGATKGTRPFVVTRPFRAPHHTTSAIGLLGGGAKAIPGEVSLAHRGVLFLDEFAEFPRSVLEVLRQPLEDGHVGVSRAMGAYDYPSRFMLVAAMNPCPCGYHNDPTHHCRCKLGKILQYQNRISGPLMDRIDIQVGVQAVPLQDLQTARSYKTSAQLRESVMRARAIQRERYRDMPGVLVNAEVKSRNLPTVCGLESDTLELLQKMISEFNLSARAYDRLLRVGRTIADLAGHEKVEGPDLAEAAMLRQLDMERESLAWTAI